MASFGSNGGMAWLGGGGATETMTTIMTDLGEMVKKPAFWVVVVLMVVLFIVVMIFIILTMKASAATETGTKSTFRSRYMPVPGTPPKNLLKSGGVSGFRSGTSASAMLKSALNN